MTKIATWVDDGAMNSIEVWTRLQQLLVECDVRIRN